MDDPRWVLTKRVISSDAFAKSPRLCEFLTYVSKHTLTGHGEQINEQMIGEQVFDRQAGYDPGQDNIVRVHASRLRQKLEIYFKEEGATEPIRIVIPKGGYSPKFEAVEASPALNPDVRVRVQPDAAETVVQAAVPESGKTKILGRRRKWFPSALVGFGAFASLALMFLLYESSQGSLSLFGTRFVALPAYRDHALWQLMFEKGRPTLIVPADSGLVLYESQANKGVSLPEYLSGDVQTVPQINPSATLDSPTSKTGYRYTSIVDLRVATDLMVLPEAIEYPPKIRYARDLKLDDLKGANVILIGAKDANPWAALFDDQLNFVFDVDRSAHASVVTNKKPEKGEEPTYRRYEDDPANRAYALIAFLPNLNRNGNVLIMEGTTMAGTEAAADFVFEGKRLGTSLKWDGRGRLPYFELLLQTTSLGGNAPESRVVGYRIHP
ncbi:MAG: hypothetical protein ABI380_15540 [Edaphobacter sp.]